MVLKERVAWLKPISLRPKNKTQNKVQVTNLSKFFRQPHYAETTVFFWQNMDSFDNLL